MNLSDPELEQALNYHGAGRFSEAIALYRKIIDAHPDFAEVYANLGNALKASGLFAEAIAAYQTALKLRPQLVRIYVNLGNTLGQQGKYEEASTAYRKALRARPDFVEALYNLGNAQRALGDLETALTCFRRAVVLQPALAQAHHNIGTILKQQGKSEEALVAFHHAISEKPNFAEAYNKISILLLELGRVDEAIASSHRALACRANSAETYNTLGNALKSKGDLAGAERAIRDAIRIKPDYLEAHNNLGTILHEQGHTDEAFTCYEKALNINPNYAEAHFNVGVAFLLQGKSENAIEAFQRAISLQPKFVDAYTQLGTALCRVNRIEEGFSSFTRGAEFACLTPKKLGSFEPNHRLKHDREQREFCSKFVADAAIQEHSLHIEGGERVVGAAINLMNTVDNIQQQWHENRPQIVVVDNLLTQEALEQLRHFCWGSTIWREVFDDGYLGARPETGFAAPLLAQIANELRLVYPAIFGRHPLLYSWAFKYESGLNGTRIHADFAAVNVNFWITPEEANLDANTGGLVVWDVAAPLDWNFQKYNTDTHAIREFLARTRAKSIRIPYRANRAVIFDSDLFHETDKMSFKEGYQNRRINITLLYGTRDKVNAE